MPAIHPVVALLQVPVSTAVRPLGSSFDQE